MLMKMEVLKFMVSRGKGSSFLPLISAPLGVHDAFLVLGVALALERGSIHALSPAELRAAAGLVNKLPFLSLPLSMDCLTRMSP
jgi:hypothetical protein